MRINNSVLTIPKATVAGIGVVISGQLLYFGFIQHELIRFILLSTPAVAAFVAAYLAPRRKVLIGMSMAIYGAVLGILMARAYEYFGGHVDKIGGPWETLTILLAYNIVLSIAGSAIGLFLSRNPRNPRKI